MAKNKYPLTTQTYKITLVIRKNKRIPISKLKEYCETYFEEYSFIEHQKDIEPVTKLVEGCHYHIVGNLKLEYHRDRLQTTLNHCVDFFKFDNANGIEIDKYDKYVNCIQYLIHKNQPEKTPHQASEIYTNIDMDTMNLYLTSDSGDIITFDMVYSICYSSHNIVEVIKQLGFKNYHRYRSSIQDIYEFCKRKRLQEQHNGIFLSIDKVIES